MSASAPVRVGRLASAPLSVFSTLCSRRRGAPSDASTGQGLSPQSLASTASLLSDRAPTPAPTLLPQIAPEDRVEELVQDGASRREALRQVARENIDAEIRQGVAETLQQGQLPSCSRICGRLCGALVVVLLVAAVLALAGIIIGCWALHLLGWFWTWWLLSCGYEADLRAWLLAFQCTVLAHAVARSFFRGCMQKAAAALDGRVRLGCARSVSLCLTLARWGLKVWWCVHVQALVARRSQELVQHPEELSRCGHALPRFMGWYSCLLLLACFVAEPALCAGSAIAFVLANSGLLVTTRGARPQTLESMQVVEFHEELFAAADDPTDERPQRECCFCLDAYDGESAIVKTPCSHMMHRECLGKWLKTSRFCPICRGDLETDEHVAESATQDV